MREILCQGQSWRKQQCTKFNSLTTLDLSSTLWSPSLTSYIFYEFFQVLISFLGGEMRILYFTFIVYVRIYVSYKALSNNIMVKLTITIRICTKVEITKKSQARLNLISYQNDILYGSYPKRMQPVCRNIDWTHVCILVVETSSELRFLWIKVRWKVDSGTYNFHEDFESKKEKFSAQNFMRSEESCSEIFFWTTHFKFKGLREE